MQIDDAVVAFLFQLGQNLPYSFPDGSDPIDIRVVGHNCPEACFGQIVYLSSQLLFQAANNRAGQDDITDGTETND